MFASGCTVPPSLDNSSDTSSRQHLAANAESQNPSRCLYASSRATASSLIGPTRHFNAVMVRGKMMPQSVDKLPTLEAEPSTLVWFETNLWPAEEYPANCRYAR
ncbi:hypothetical protein V2G26_018853 [Clonostachys chloroleuca]